MLPFKFKSNRVRRLYRGGSGIDRLRGAAAPADDRYPEDWIASCVEANSREFVAPGHGLSVAELAGSEIAFPALLKDAAAELLGPEHLARFGAAPAVLTKLLDSAVLLPLQVHPDRACARRCYGSDFGKTEAWIVLATREIGGEKPYLLLGFNDRLDPDVFRQESRDGRYLRGLDMLHRLEVSPGDVFVVYGRMPHAIGPGITMVEVMEPTDYVIIPEYDCFGVALTPEKRFGGLPPETALDIFDYTPMSREAVIARCCPVPELMADTAEATLRRLIPRREVKFFEAQRLDLRGDWRPDPAERTFRIGIVVAGDAVLTCGDQRLDLRGGDSFFVPFSTPEWHLSGRAGIVMVLPPEAAASSTFNQE